VHAYMWFLIAGEQITQAKNHAEPVDDHGATARSQAKSRRMDEKDQKDCTSWIDNPPNASTA
jgi:hypothetical protein